MIKFALSLLLAFLGGIDSFASVSPLDYGLLDARDGVERFWALYRAHSEAMRLGTGVDYSGVGDIQLTIPPNAKSIPLIKNTDFCGITIEVENTCKDFQLFLMDYSLKEIFLSQDRLDGDDFRDVEDLQNGTRLLVMEDENPWVKNRKGYSYGHIRRDIRLIENGRAKNKTVMPYGNSLTTKPRCWVVNTNNDQIIIENLNIERLATSTYKTFCMRVDGQNNVLITNIKITTPWNTGMYGDGAISLHDCTNVRFEDVTIDGTYSLKDKYGYGIAIGNCWNVTFKRIKADANWGVFCCNNLNTAHLEDCNVNRFDTHCYGRDFSFENCFLHDGGLMMSSVYGKISYKNCTFRDFDPICIRYEYNCFVPFDVEMKDCSMLASKKDKLIYMGRLTNELSDRPELHVKNWPNLKIDGLRIIPENNIKTIYIYHVGGAVDKNIVVHNINNVNIRGLRIDGDVEFRLCTQRVSTAKRIKCKIQQSRVSSQF